MTEGVKAQQSHDGPYQEDVVYEEGCANKNYEDKAYTNLQSMIIMIVVVHFHLF